MIKTVGSVATDLQTIAHEGLAECPIFIKRLDGIYDVGEIRVYERPSGKKFFVIEAKGFSEE